MEKININPKFLLRVENTHLKKVYIKLIENLYEK
jgi:hypothetical protein